LPVSVGAIAHIYIFWGSFGIVFYPGVACYLALVEMIATLDDDDDGYINAKYVLLGCNILNIR